MTEKKPGWKEYPLAAVISKPGSCTYHNTGDWKTMRPVRDDSKCDKCGFCWIICPDAALFMGEDGYYEVDLYHCKGCGICAHECKKSAIRMIPEEH